MTAAHRGGVPLRVLQLAAKAVSSLLLAGVVVLFAGLAIGPHLAGYRTETMLSASMSPYIRPGDIAVDTVQPLSKLRTGQIITFHIPTGDHRVVSHRVIALTRTAGGEVDVRTKGDANTAPDQWTAHLSGGQVWRVRTVIPRLGHLIGLLRGPNLRLLLPAGLAAFAADALPRPGTPRPGTPRPGAPRPGLIMSRHTTISHRCWSRRAAGLVLPAAATAILTAAPALARTSGTRTASAGYTSATLAPPTALTLTKSCSTTSSTSSSRWAGPRRPRRSPPAT